MKGDRALGLAASHAADGARASAPVCVAFRGGKRVGVRDYKTFAAQWLACTIPCRRFTDTLAGTAARLGADVDVAVDTVIGVKRQSDLRDNFWLFQSLA
jgi:hypothetical protein